MYTIVLTSNKISVKHALLIHEYYLEIQFRRLSRISYLIISDTNPNVEVFYSTPISLGSFLPVPIF